MSYLARLREKNAHTHGEALTKLTKGGHQPDSETFVSSVSSVDAMIATACRGLTITVEQLRAELAEAGDLDDVASGALDADALRTVAETLALMRYTTEPPSEAQSVTCADCRHFQRIEHPHLGHCARGEPESIAGNWDTDRRSCGSFEACET